MTATHVDINPTKIRVGLGIISLIFAGSVVLFLATSDPLGKAMMVAVAFVCLVRIALLVRWIRTDRRSSVHS